jgi:TPP-dependent pyruvate/acetoin dehydrogenase alpha subunit
MEQDHETLLAIYALMGLTRTLEDAARDLMRHKQMPGPLFSARGLEATTVGAALALEAGDTLAPERRDLGALLAHGVSPRAIVAHWLLRASSPSQGREGWLHFGVSGDRAVLPTLGVPGLGLAVAAGAALAAQRQRAGRVVLAFIGDAATNTGDFHEALNLAATLNLPLICVIEHNLTPAGMQPQFRLRHLADRAAAYGIPGHVVEGTDPLAVLAVTRQAVDLARAGHGPSLIEAKVRRIVGPAADRSIPASVLGEWRAHDPIERFTRVLEAEGLLGGDTIAAQAARIAQTVQDAITTALNAPLPDPTTLTDHVFAPDPALFVPAPARAPVLLAIERNPTRWR